MAEFEPAEYQKLAVRTYAPRSLRETAEGKYWRRFKAPVTAKQVCTNMGRVQCVWQRRSETAGSGMPSSQPETDVSGLTLSCVPRAVRTRLAHRLLPTVPLQPGHHRLDKGKRWEPAHWACCLPGPRRLPAAAVRGRRLAAQPCSAPAPPCAF